MRVTQQREMTLSDVLLVRVMTTQDGPAQCG